MHVLVFIVIGYALAGAAGLYSVSQGEPLVGLVIAWLGGNVLALLLAYGWFRIDMAVSAWADARAVGSEPPPVLPQPAQEA